MKYQGRLISDNHPPASAKEVAALEALLGCRIPDDYRDFLLRVNGGYMEYEVPILFEDGHREFIAFSALYRLEPGGSWETNPYELDQARAMGALPSRGVLPIACDAGGSTLYLDLREGSRIVALVHGLPAWTGRHEQDALLPVAGSFTEYLQKLVISDDLAECHISDFEVSEESVAATIEWLDSGSPDWRVRFRDLWNTRVPGHQV